MRGSNKLLAVIAGVAACSLVATVLHAPTLIMAVFGFALLTSLGYVWIEVILQGRAPALELVSVAVGLVLAAPVLGGVALFEAGVPLSRTVWSCFFVGLTLVGDAVLAFRYRSLEKHDYENQLLIQRQRQHQRAVTQLDLRAPLEPIEEQTPHPAQPVTPRPREWAKWPSRVPPWQAIGCGLAVLVVGSAIWIARAGAASQQYPGFTELWLSSQNHSKSIDNLGVSNHQGGTERYKLVLLRKGHVSATWGLTLTTGQTWQKTIHITSPTEANLYLLPDLSRPYRHVDTEP
jgi:hypothetical protein